ncbi:hypothetical protein C0Q70_04925 [Pomacea canaliculata]|uniref:Tyrosine specific protein phosphatases domain-containing protein n=1 Tax=Pomacea canaliculata TaxID=400727 RepID=A0A2T7PJU7_POMCA|nr:hypothetical protein C0Q70_04925 [Pomacea canaliculata]
MDSTVTVYTVQVKCRHLPVASSRLVRVYHCRTWPKISHKPHRLVKKRDDKIIPHTDHFRSLLRVLEQVVAWQQETTHESTPILLHCSDGFSRSGLMVAIAQMIWRANEEGRVSIYRVVRRLRICCPNAVAHYVQYKFLHRLLWVYTRGVVEEVPSDGAKPCTYNITDDDNPKTSPEVANPPSS